MKTIHTRPISDLSVDRDGYDEARKALIGIADYIADGNYVKGNRNTIAVDYCIACRIIDYDPELAIEFLDLNAEKRANLRDRVKTIIDYIPKWWKSRNIKSYALDWDSWIKLFDQIENDPEKDHDLKIESILKL